MKSIIRILILASLVLVVPLGSLQAAQTPRPQVKGAQRTLLAVTRQEYTFGDTAFTPPGFPGAVELTDSDGIQEEVPGLGVPVLVMRHVTERPEAVAAGTARLVGTDTATIVAEAVRLLDDSAAHGAMARAVNPFGDGRAAERIVSILLREP